MTQESTEIDDARAEASETVCSEDEFTPILAEQVGLLVHIDDRIKLSPRAQLSRRLLATISEESSDLEDLLEDYDARYNQTFAGLLELVASLRVFSAFGYTVKNVQVRSTSPPCLATPELDQEFVAETSRSLQFAERSVRSLLSGIHEEILTISGYAFSAEAPARVIMQDGILQKKLPHTVGAGDSTDGSTRIATEASLFVSALTLLRRRSEGRRFDDVLEMQQFVCEVCDEEQSRFLEAKLHNIQSRYDTFIKNTTTEREDRNLLQFRYLIGMSLQLVKMMTLLAHFYERHEDDIREEEAKGRVTQLIDKVELLDRLLNYALYFTHHFTDAAEPVAKQIIDDYTNEETVELAIPEGCLLHARPASLIAKIVSHHGTPVTMSFGEDSCYAGSPIKVVVLSGSHLQERSVTFTGDRRPIADITALFAARLGEDGVDALPDELAYLR